MCKRGLGCFQMSYIIALPRTKPIQLAPRNTKARGAKRAGRKQKARKGHNAAAAKFSKLNK